MKPYRILVAPLDWGLGHATRCIPVIQLLLKKGCEVHVASSGNAQHLLQLEFSQLKYFNLPSYAVKYSRWLPFMLQVFLQMPKFLLVIRSENRIIGKLVDEHKYDLVISDNRYGCYSSKVKTVFISHQINIIMPRWLRWLAPIVNYFNHQWIMKFNQCWIPDDPAVDLTGRLTVPCLPNVKWIGLLSRFEKGKKTEIEFQLAIVLSGPEPQRSVFEKIILSQLSHLSVNSVLVRGRLDADTIQSENKNLMTFNHMKGEELQSVIEKSECVLCRSGYSTIMDLSQLGKKAILVPTPGQTEQEYLGFRLMKKGVAFCQHQENFNLEYAFKEIKNYSGFAVSSAGTNLLDEAIEEILK